MWPCSARPGPPGTSTSICGFDLPAVSGNTAHLLHLVASGVPGKDGWHSLALAPQQGRANPAVSGKELADALAAAPTTPEIMVLAAPDTGLLAADLAAVVPTVIGFRDQISEAARLEFVRGFYLGLSAGHTVEQAASGRGARRPVGRPAARGVGPAGGVLRIGCAAPTRPGGGRAGAARRCALGRAPDGRISARRPGRPAPSR